MVDYIGGIDTEFYRVLAKYYDEIFTLKEQQRKFLRAFVEREKLNSVLDVGCGTGTLALELSAWGVSATGIDLSDAMIDIACHKAAQQGSTAKFLAADMLALDRLRGQFDAVVCVGNTLPHLTQPAQLQLAMEQFAVKSHCLLLQVVNYDRILAQNVTELPEICTPNLVFRRYYKHLPGMIEFSMRLETANPKEVLTAVNNLVPLTRQDLVNIFAGTGWEATDWWGSYAGEKWSVDGAATIVALRR
ncbi:MAG: class I SAM-dependent methyltransferase [Peptococcaceae bacterium]|nr:class I SAM-dependent methyltransferase [Peptococcaceae bacterium]